MGTSVVVNESFVESLFALFDCDAMLRSISYFRLPKCVFDFVGSIGSNGFSFGV